MEKNGEVNIYGDWHKNDTIWCSNLNHVRPKHSITYNRTNTIYGNNGWADDYWGLPNDTRNHHSQATLYETQKLRDDIDGAM